MNTADIKQLALYQPFRYLLKGPFNPHEAFTDYYDNFAAELELENIKYENCDRILLQRENGNFYAGILCAGAVEGREEFLIDTGEYLFWQFEDDILKFFKKAFTLAEKYMKDNALKTSAPFRLVRIYLEDTARNQLFIPLKTF